VAAARVVLVGGGHAHLEVLRDAARRPLGAELVLVSPEPRQLYSGMMPGQLRGAYAEADLAGYRIGRATTAGGPYTALHAGTLAPTPSSFVDTSAQPGQTVHYRVVAVDRAGNVSAPADAAYTVPGTPLANPFAWRALAPSPVPRFEASGAGVGGRLFVFGGFVTTDIRSTARSDVSAAGGGLDTRGILAARGRRRTCPRPSACARRDAPTLPLPPVRLSYARP